MTYVDNDQAYGRVFPCSSTTVVAIVVFLIFIISFTLNFPDTLLAVRVKEDDLAGPLLDRGEPLGNQGVAAAAATFFGIQHRLYFFSVTYVRIHVRKNVGVKNIAYSTAMHMYRHFPNPVYVEKNIQICQSLLYVAEEIAISGSIRQ